MRTAAGPSRLLLLAAVLVAPAAVGQEPLSARHATGIELTAETQKSLARLNELWRDFQGALRKDEAAPADKALAELLATASGLGLPRLPDFAAGAGALAIDAEEQGHAERAERALDAARRLDPELPETAFAAAAVAGIRGEWLAGLRAELDGAVAGSRLMSVRRVWAANALTFSLEVLLASGGIFFAFQLATKGGGLAKDLWRLLARALPPAGAALLTGLVLVWPIALPSGFAWLLLYWSILIWGYGSASEKGVIIGLWIVLGLAPLALEQGRRWVRAENSPQFQALENLEHGRLTGSLFADLGTLRSTLPGSQANRHLQADVYRILGQWDLARLGYQQVLASDESRSSVLLNLGAYAYYSGEYAKAVDYFRRAAKADPEDPAGYFNLSKAYRKQIYFDEANAALAKAREIDDDRVSRWLRTTEGDGIQISAEGLGRAGEIRRELAAVREEAEAGAAGSRIGRYGLSLLLGLGCILLGVTLDLARRPFGYSELPFDLRESRSLSERLLRAFLPGFKAAELGEGVRSFLLLLLPVSLAALVAAALPFYRAASSFGGGLPRLAVGLALLALVSFFGVRCAQALRSQT